MRHGTPEEQPSAPPSNPPLRSGPGSGTAWAIAFAVVAVTAIAAVAFIFHECSPRRISGNIASNLAQAFQPQINASTLVFSTVSNMVNQSKLVVLSTSINVEMTKSHEKIVWGVPLGTTKVTLRALDNRVQYYIPLTNLTAGDFRYDHIHKRLTLRVPHPKLDQEVVEVQSDPGKIEFRTDVGWARLNSRSGQFLREQAQRELRPAILREGNNSLYIDRAKSNARESLKKLLEPMAGQLKEDVELDIEFK